MTEYPWTTPEQQARKNPYAFDDVSGGIEDGYYHGRQAAVAALRERISPLNSYGYSPYTLEELAHRESFDTIRVAATLRRLQTIGAHTATAPALHAARILKKVNVRALKERYDNQFKNIAGADEATPETMAVLGAYFGEEARAGDYLALSTTLKLNDAILARFAELSSPRHLMAAYESLTKEADAMDVFKKAAQGVLAGEQPLHMRAGYQQKTIPIGMYAQDTNRTKAYLQLLARAGYRPSHVILASNGAQEALDTPVPNRLFDLRSSTQELLERADIPYTLVRADSLNDPAATAALADRPEAYFVFSGRGKLTAALEQGKKLIHVHPGKLPDFRGSTTIHYQLLQRGDATATAFIMEPELDAGSVIASRTFEPPWPGVDLTRVYDPYIRSSTLAAVFKEYDELGRFEPTPQRTGGREFYVIHPLLEYHLKRQFA